MENYYSSGRMMFKLAEALGRLALAGRELTRLSGFTSRIDTLMNVLDDIEQGKYQRTMISTDESVEEKEFSQTLKFSTNSDIDFSSSNSSNSLINFYPGAGRIINQDNLIRFDKVPLVTPNGDVLITSLDLEVPSGTNVLVCGPNGCGKSSLFRVLGELWPLWGGKMIKPAKGKLFYVPQRPYMVIGTLRDQVIYPDRPSDMRKKGYRDSDLAEFLSAVQLDYILVREGGWESQQDWMDVLSGGEKQRIAMARLFYHRPQFAILDECTSADVEGLIYKKCQTYGTTLFTVSHRRSLWKYHINVLRFDGRGNYSFGAINQENIEEQFGS